LFNNDDLFLLRMSYLVGPLLHRPSMSLFLASCAW